MHLDFAGQVRFRELLHCSILARELGMKQETTREDGNSSLQLEKAGAL